MKVEPLFVSDPSLKERLLLALSKGADFEIASHYAGVDPRTFKAWRSKGKKIRDLPADERNKHPYKIYYDLLIECQKVKSIACCHWLQCIDRAAETTWQAAAWKLERTYPDKYAKVEKVKVSGDKEKIKDAKEYVKKLKKEK